MSEILTTPTNAPITPGTPAPHARAPQRLYVLKESDTFLVADAYGDVTGEGDGLFQNDTRILSTFELQMGGRQPTLLSSAVSQDNAFFTANLTNHPLPFLGATSMPEGVIHLERRRFLWDGRIFERLSLVNFSDQAARVPLRVRYAADFRDMFEVRGQQRARRGEMQMGNIGASSAELRYHGLDALWRNVVISFSEVPVHISNEQADFDVLLGERQRWEMYIEVGSSAAQPDRQRYRSAAAKVRRGLRMRRRRGARVRASGRLFQAWLDKSEADLALLTTELPTGPYPYAGIPWFSTPFGRDAVVTALQTLWLDPALARGVLAFLAHHQSHETSTFRDAEPGKIMHETRKGEMAAVNELPFGKYYGGVDTTPLFIMLAGAYAERTDDLAFIDEIWPALTSATRWIEDNAARHGRGFLCYARGEKSGLANQGWKDSHDSVFHENGFTPNGPIALIEVQGYAYRALRAVSGLAKLRGDHNLAEQWSSRALELAEAVEKHFWLEDKQFYALALDGDGQACRVRASNAGHLLYTGLPSQERGDLVAKQLLSSAFDSGWGIRTLAAEAARFNPMSYHNGSVWPHDVALCAAGLAHYGEREGVVRLLGDMFEGAAYFAMRLPELYCGFEREAGEAPIAYPVACLPQAWAAGSVFMLLQACLGIRIDVRHNTVTIDRPRLPNGIETLQIKRLEVGTKRLDLTFQRLGERVVAFVDQPAGPHMVRVDLRL